MCDVVSLLALVMWLSRLLVTTLLWSGLCLFIRVAMGKEHQESKRAIRNNQQELSEQSAVSMKDPRLIHRKWLSLYDHYFAISKLMLK